MNIGQAFLLALGTAVAFGTLIVRSRTRGGGLVFFALSGLAVALLLAGFGLFTVTGITG